MRHTVLRWPRRGWMKRMIDFFLYGLKAGKKYYVQIRTYKTIDGKEYYAEWSQTRSAKVKK